MRALFLTVSFFFLTRASAQEMDLFISKANSALPSWNKLKMVLHEYGNNHAKADTTVSKQDDFTWLSERLLDDAFVYDDNSTLYTGSAEMLFTDIQVVHNGTAVLYLSIVHTGGRRNDVRFDKSDTLLRYIDEVFLANVLYPHNAKNYTEYTWKDLFEDRVITFTSGRGGMSPEYGKTFTQIVPYITKRDYEAIRLLRLSLNPTRRAYAAAALAAIKSEGTILPAPEKEWLENMRCNSTRIHYVAGCEGYYKETSYLLSDEMMRRFCQDVKEFRRKQDK